MIKCHFILFILLLLSACDTHDMSGGGGVHHGAWTPEYDLTGLTIDGEFPIVAWTGVEFDKLHKFEAMKECGFNTYLGWYDDVESVMTALDAAEDHGLKLIVRSDDFFSNPQEEAVLMKEHPALFMYYIEDEPEVGELHMLSDIVDEVNEVDSEHPCYINVYPNWCWGGTQGYMSHLVNYRFIIPTLKFISFDYYPLIYGNDGKLRVREGWYKNLEDVRYIARAEKVPFWAFALSLATESHRIPTLGDLRLQMFANLVYGCQGFQYWTYWGIYQNAGPTSVYEKVKTVNAELQSMSKYFLGSDVVNVWHTGTNIPLGSHKLTQMPPGVKTLSADESGVIVSQVEKNGEIYIAIVNKDFDNQIDFNITFEGSARQIDKRGYKGATDGGHFIMPPGDMLLFQVK